MSKFDGGAEVKGVGADDEFQKPSIRTRGGSWTLRPAPEQHGGAQNSDCVRRACGSRRKGTVQGAFVGWEKATDNEAGTGPLGGGKARDHAKKASGRFLG